MNRKGFTKISLSILIGLTVLLTLYTLNVAAVILPGNVTETMYPALVNLTKGDMFFANGNSVFIVVNYTCAPTTVCNESLIVTGNFSEIGGSDSRAGVFKGNNSLNTWALFELNDTVDMTSLSNIVISPKTIYLNATDPYDGAVFNNQISATVVLVNMSTLPGCPPAGTQLPPVIPLNDGTIVPISSCTASCTGEDRAEFNGTDWNVCGPNFGGSTTNFTQVASTGNFSNFPFVIEIPNKVKINFTNNVSMDTPQKAMSLFEFAMRNMMSGPKIGINDTEWNGNNNKPNLTTSALITFYNVSGRFGFTGRPQIIKYATGSSSGSSCPIGVCSNFVWNGQNLTFGVTGFSDYGLTDAINVTLSYPGSGSLINNPAVGFIYAPVFNTSISPKNCTLYGNFSGTWAANASNSTPISNMASNTLTTNVGPDGVYVWNVYCFDASDQFDYASSNSTVIIDTTLPQLANNVSSIVSTYSPSNVSVFNATWTDSNGLNNTEAMIEGNWSGVPANYTPDLLGSVYSYNTTLPAGALYWKSYAKDNAGNWNSSGKWEFTVAKANGSSVLLTLNNGTLYNDQNITSIYGSSIGANCSNAIANSGPCAIYINGAAVSNTTSDAIGVGANSYKVNTSGNSNYSANATGETFYFIVSKGTPTMILQIDGAETDKSVTSGTTTNTTGIDSNNGDSDCTYTLYRSDTTNVSNPNSVTLTTAGAYAYVYNTSGGANWTSASATRTLTITSSSSNTGTSAGGLTTSTYATPYVRIAKDSANITLTSLTTSGKMIATIARYDGIAIRGINITVLNNVANIKLVITRLSVLPQTVSYNIDGQVFNYISVDESNITNSDLKTVSMRFAVNKTWLSDNGVTDSNITLYRWNGNSWTDLNAAKTGEDSLEVFYLATSPGLSVFVVGTKGGAPQAVATTCTESWTCSEWSSCVSDQQTRTCTDSNACGTSLDMPAETQSCTVETSAVPTSAQLPSVDYTVPFIISIVAIAACIAIFIYRKKITGHLHWLHINHIKRKRENAKDIIEGKLHIKSE